MPHTITLRREGLEARRRSAGWNDADLARNLGMSHAAVSRILAGRTQPGPAFIAGALHAFGESSFRELFEITPRKPRMPRARAAA